MRHILLRSLLDIFVIILLGHRDYTFFYIERGGGIHPTFFGKLELVVGPSGPPRGPTFWGGVSEVPGG